MDKNEIVEVLKSHGISKRGETKSLRAFLILVLNNTNRAVHLPNYQEVNQETTIAEMEEIEPIEWLVHLRKEEFNEVDLEVLLKMGVSSLSGLTRISKETIEDSKLSIFAKDYLLKK
jgi:hypothetical protein